MASKILKPEKTIRHVGPKSRRINGIIAELSQMANNDPAFNKRLYREWNSLFNDEMRKYEAKQRWYQKFWTSINPFVATEVDEKVSYSALCRLKDKYVKDGLKYISRE